MYSLFVKLFIMFSLNKYLLMLMKIQTVVKAGNVDFYLRSCALREKRPPYGIFLKKNEKNEYLHTKE